MKEFIENKIITDILMQKCNANNNVETRKTINNRR